YNPYRKGWKNGGTEADAKIATKLKWKWKINFSISIFYFKSEPTFEFSNTFRMSTNTKRPSF
ncbi:MAG: hypothetical protein AAFO82_23790, partial [Bacteroidota bacterium]